MLKKRPWTVRFTVGVSIASALGLAQAAGLAGGAGGAVLGQPLDHAVTLRLDASESLTPGCVGAEVSIGDRRLPAGQVRVLVEPQGSDAARVRVQTTMAIDEPVVSVLINAHCGAAVSRRFVLFADPPAIAAPAPASLAAPATADAASVAGDATARLAAPGDVAVASTLSTRSVALREAAASRSNRPNRRAEARAQKRRAAATVARADPPRRAQRRVTEPPTPRLKLDFAATAVNDNSAIEEALQAVAAAAAAARQSASSASAAAERIATLERTVEQLHGEAKSSRDMSTQMRDQLRRAEASAQLLWLMAAAAAALAALAAWLGMRLTATRREQAAAWRQAARQAAPEEPEEAQGPPPSTFGSLSRMRTLPAALDMGESDSGQASASPRSRPAPAWPPPAPPDDWPVHDSRPPAPSPRAAARAAVADVQIQPAVAAPAATRRGLGLHPQHSLSPTQITAAMPSLHRIEGTGPRDVSIDELLDLEQQAEFFVVLGQDEAAIDLLVEHLRHTGGGSPLPYLKLLEVYRRRGDREDYERTRTRFNHRFNAYAPEWDVDLQSGRSLVDYKGVLPRLQQVWSRPLDSMAELEALLFRKSRGELFDLPAYREVLFLYALARDLLDRESADTGQVDLLLPLSDSGEFSSTAPAPFELGRDSQHARADFEDRPTSPVDLDLSLDSDRPASIFDRLEERPQALRRR